MNSRSILATAIVLSLAGCRQATQTATNAAASAARSTARDAYVFGFPLVLMDTSRAKMTNVPSPSEGFSAPRNQFANAKTFPDATFTDVVSPNADTLYSSAWFDLSQGPMVLSVPDTHGRYYLMPMLDAWTNVFASPGKRTTGTGKGDFAITGPGWTGTLPAGMKQIKAPTNMVWLIGRTQTNGKSDYAAVHAIQAGYRLTPLSAWGKPYTPAQGTTDPSVDMKASPVETVAAMDASAFFSRLAALMQANSPAPEDAPMVARMAAIGVVPGQQFTISKNGADIGKAIADGVNDGKQRVKDLGQNPGNIKIVNGWMIATKDIGTYGTNYDARAGVAWAGLGANIPDDAVYPLARTDGEGQPLDGANRYVIHFDKGQTPPVNALWSLTMYNAKQAFVANPLNRYAIGDRDRLKFNPDGSLDIYLQHESPGKEKESNWLPADAGSFNVAMRLYWPKEPVLSGIWTPPPIKKQ
ncbi:MAG: DUF1254 domain-containing protein [Terracidiphilus sp.]